MSVIKTRGHQLFPVLDGMQIDTAKRFASGPGREFAPGEIIYNAGERGVPTWLVLKGSIAAVRRDGLDHEPCLCLLERTGCSLTGLFFLSGCSFMKPSMTWSLPHHIGCRRNLNKFVTSRVGARDSLPRINGARALLRRREGDWQA